MGWQKRLMKERILIVEDNLQSMRLIEMTLKAKGYTLLEAFDGEEAIEVAVRERPDLVILDIQLPKMSGLEVTKKLRETPGFAHTPIIAITAYAMKGDKEKVIDAGCDLHLSKPINTRELPALIAQMLQQRRRDGV